MIHRTRFLSFSYICRYLLLAGLAAGCGEGAGPVAPAADAGADGTGGAGTGGGASTGGRPGTGYDAGTSVNTGGAPGSGGASSTGGATATGGRTGTGGSMSTGGNAGGGGAGATGGALTGGAGGRGGGAGVAGAAGAGGVAGAGGASVRLDGRIDYSDQAHPTFSWSGSAMVARFQGTGATLRIDGSPNQFQVVVDGMATSPVLKVVSGTSQYALVSGLPAGMHDLVVWRRTEGNLGDNRFLGLDVSGGQLLAAPAAPERRVEIYGDSITAGYGMDGAGPTCARTSDTDNHYLTYGAVMARALSVDLHTVAWSGIGMYRNYNVAGASPDAMPSVHARTLADNASKTWDFSKWQPHAVVINLGTNDFSTKGDPGMPYRTAYLDFVRALRLKYPNTFFVLTIGPMLDGANLTAVRAHLQAVIQTRATEGDAKMSYLEFPTQVQADGYGCDYHPSAATNMKMAALLTAQLKTRLGW